VDFQIIHSNCLFTSRTNDDILRGLNTLFFMEVITEGKVKTVYTGDDADRVIIEYHDKVTAGNGEKEDHPLERTQQSVVVVAILLSELSHEQ